MTDRYRIDPGHSRLTVQAFAAGLLSFMGHSPTFAVRPYLGELRWQPGSAEAGLDVTVQSEALELVDPVRTPDREEIERRMRQEVLETAAYPEVRFEAGEVATMTLGGERYRLRLAGTLALRGTARRQTLDAELIRYDDGVRLGGSFPLRLSEYGIRPVQALGGALHLRDELQVAFDLAAWKETAA